MTTPTSLIRPRETFVYDPVTDSARLQRLAVTRYSRPLRSRQAAPAKPALSKRVAGPRPTPTAQATPTKAVSKTLEYGPLAAAVAQNEKSLAQKQRRHIA